jgi:hypothetical protein
MNARNTNVKFEFESFLKINNERLTVTLTNNEPLSIILGLTQVVAPGGVAVIPNLIFSSDGPTVGIPGPSDKFTMQFPTAFPPVSKSVEIKTRMQIDGDEYDASAMFGVPSSIALAGVITITPEITIRDFVIEKYKNKTPTFVGVFIWLLNVLLSYVFVG